MSPGSSAAGGQGQRLLDIAPMRRSALRLLGDAGPEPAPVEVEALIHRIRADVKALIPEVEKAAQARPDDDIARYCALACVGEAGLRLNARLTGAAMPLSLARRLARCLFALCEHYESLAEPMVCVLCDGGITDGEDSAPYGQITETGVVKSSRAHRGCLPQRRFR
ncbi:DUF6415 family natural product biosynthesis protein [Streptomyces mexicanus]|uniref:DUF6415 family natural product biosynthesis protein n=1 Tax=Streptomyces mexicanus TaxID=178566 RepID=UPI0036CE761D